MKFLLLFVLTSYSYALPSFKIYRSEKDFVEIINSKRSTWKAGENFDLSSIPLHSLVGVLKTDNKTLSFKVHEIHESIALPSFFDARLEWPDCSMIGEIRDQASCGSCWAFGAVEAMSDRICIHSNGTKQVSVSAEDLTACCDLQCGLGCYGGFPDSAWIYWAQTGIVTGGLYGTNDGCKSYSIPPCSHYTNVSSKSACGGDILTPICVTHCDVATMSYEKELTFGDSAYYISSDQDQIKAEIMVNGPVEASFDVYEDFLYYKSGVYQNLEGNQLGGHAVKILGWGEEDDTPYWLVANSYGTDWGDEGFFKILRGVDHVGIESNVVAGLPRL